MMLHRRAFVLLSTAVGLATPAPAEKSTDLKTLLAANSDGVLTLRGGRYSADDIKIEKPVRIEGIPGQTRLEAGGTGPLFTVRNTENVSFAGISFTGRNDQPTEQNLDGALLVASDVANLRIENCAFSGSAASGLRLEKCSGEILHNRFSKLGNFGLFALDCSALLIDGNRVDDIGNNGISVWQTEPRADGARIVNNVISNIRIVGGGTGQNGNGILVFRAGNVVVANNRIADTGYSGIRCNSGSNVSITGNSISRARETALYVEFAFEGAVVANNIIEDAAAGISITNFDQGGRLAVCTGNVVRRMKAGTFTEAPEGTGIHGEADTLIANNVIEDVEATAISLGWGGQCRNLMAQGNMIRTCGQGIVFSVAEGAGRMLIAGNMISGAKNGAVVGMAWDKVMTGDLLVASEKPPANATMFGNVLA